MKTLRHAMAALLATTFIASEPAAPPVAAADLSFVPKAAVISEFNSQPMETVSNSATSIGRVQSLVDNWMSNRSEFKYGSTQVLYKSGDGPSRDSSGKFEIDCSSFIQALLEGVSFGTSRYAGNALNSSQFSPRTIEFHTLTQPNKQINRRLTADQLAKWSYDHGYWYAARPDFSNVKLGDVLFWHAYTDETYFKRVSHTAVITDVQADGYFEVADASEEANTINRRRLHATDLHRLQVYSGARFPLDQFHDYTAAAEADVESGWTFIPPGDPENNDAGYSQGQWTYNNPGGAALTGWQTIDSKSYFFDDAGTALFGEVLIEGSTYYIDQNYGLVDRDAWEKALDEQYNYFGPGSTKYDHFTSESRGWQEIDGSWFYFLPTTGYMARSGWNSIYEPAIGRKSWNFFRADGTAIDQLYYENGMTFMSLAGPRDYARGWHTVDGFTRYFRDTDAASMATGFQKIDGSWYFLRPSTGTRAYGWQYIDGSWYYFDSSNGVRQGEGVHTISGSYDYIHWDATSQSRLISRDGATYLTLPGPSTYATGWKTLSDGTRYFENSGAMATGHRSVGGNWYYLRPSTGTMVTGWQYIDGSWHYYRPSGTSALGNQYIDGKWYYFPSYDVGVTSR